MADGIRSGRWILAVVIVALALRLWFVLRLDPVIQLHDGREYDRLARGIVEDHAYLSPEGRPTASWPPAYPVFLAVVGRTLTGARIVQACIGALTVLLAFAIARRLLGMRKAFLAALLTAIYPLYIYASGVYYPVVLLTLLLGGVYLLLLQALGEGSGRKAFLAGILGGITALTTASSIPALGVACIWLVWEGRHRAAPGPLMDGARAGGTGSARSTSGGVGAAGSPPGGPRRRTGPVLALLYLVPIVCIVGSWTARNYLVLGAPVPISTNGGYNFWIGNFPGTEATTGNRQVYGRIEAEQALKDVHHGEVELDHAFYREALDHIMADPGRFVVLSLGKALNFWRLYPEPLSRDLRGWEKLACILSYGPLLPFGLYWLIRNARADSNVRLILLLMISYTVLHALFISKVRYRLPLDMLLVIAATGGIGDAARLCGLRFLDRSRIACIVLPAAVAVLVGPEGAAPAVAAPVEVVELGRAPEMLEPAVTFLPAAPVIDGVLDEGLAALPLRRFNTVMMRNAGNPIVPMGYRIAYGTRFLYLFLEIYSGDLYFNDRAFQNGDGFALVVASPRPDNRPSDEFYVLGCSAVDDERMEWTRHIFWYHNVDRLFLPTGAGTRMEFARTDSTIAFELLLPWSDVYPYHPWLSEGIGFNLCAVKALASGSKNLHFVVLDENVGAENKMRLYTRLRFEEPELGEGIQTYLVLRRNNITEGDTLRAACVTLASHPSEEELRTAVQTREGRNITVGRPTYRCGPGLTWHETAIESHALPTGEYRVKWYSRAGDSEGEYGLGVLPAFDPAGLRRRIEEARHKVTPASYSTMLFLVLEVQGRLESAGPHETLADARASMTRLFDSVDGAARGLDEIAEERNFVRKAYRSELDGSLQPYVVFVPLEFDPAVRYPLLVYLHGSAEDETGITRNPRIIPRGFIALAPRGRGPSNAFSWGHAQEDISEAIEAVVESYPIDTGRIVLAGFSMGGYGVYRTYYETPGRYRGLAVFSGHPNLPNRWYGVNTYLNFKKSENLDRFAGVPVFVFHGGRDLNAPLAATELAVERMRRAGADVEFHVEAEKGHEAPGDETMEAYARWIIRVVGD